MSEMEHHRGGLFGSVRSFWGVLISVLFTRLSLASTELEEERERLEQLVVLGIGAALLTGMTVFFTAFFLIVTFWDERVYVIGSIVIVLILSTVIVGFKAYRLIASRPTFMEGTLKELRKDLEGLRRFVPKTEDKA